MVLSTSVELSAFILCRKVAVETEAVCIARLRAALCYFHILPPADMSQMAVTR